ncbi:MAG: DUF1573 domain-containing protein [Muribaculaceae bacterium]|nr:DUF1573 domain-containing protein [Muribaculaceae bacterium]
MATILAIVAQAAVAQACIEWADSVFDFGVFDESARPMTGRLRFTNTGDSALLITRVQPTCGCTIADYPTGAIAAGDTASLSLTYSPTGRPGPFEKDVFIYTNGLKHKSVVAVKGRMRGTPESVDRYYPRSAGAMRLSKTALLAGEVVKGRTRNVTTRIYNPLNDSILLRTIDCPRHISPHAVDSVLGPADATTLSLFVDTRVAPLLGRNEDTVTIAAINRHSLQADTLRLTVISNIEQDFSGLTAQQLATAPVAFVADTWLIADANGEATFTISNMGTDPLEIRRVYTEGAALTQHNCSRRLLKQGEQAAISLNASNITRQATVVVITNDPLHPVIKLPIRN